MEGVAARVAEEAGARSQPREQVVNPEAAVAHARERMEAGTGYISLGSLTLTQPFLMPQPTRTTNFMPVPSSTPSPVTSTYTTAATTGTNFMLAPSSTPPPVTGTDTTSAATAPSSKEQDETWNKRQIGYVFALGTTVALVFLLRPLLPAVYDRFILVAIAAVWGVGSFGLPCGLHGTTRCEKNFSRHVGRLVFTLFSLLVIYGIYLLALRVDGISASTPSPSPLELDEASTDGGDEFWWTVCFGTIGVIVFVGHMASWITGCCMGGDRDRDP